MAWAGPRAGSPPVNFPSVGIFGRWLTGADRAPHHENTEAKAMGRAGGPTISRACPAGSWYIEDSRRTRPPRRIGEAHGTKVGTTVEEVIPSHLKRSAADLQPKAAR